MSAHEQMRDMLDRLMGTSRNGENKSNGIKFYDQNVCKSFLLGCCPHEHLATTRMDLGDCPKLHDLALRADYEIASKSKDYYYDVEAMEHLQAFIADCDIRTERSKRRIAERQEELAQEVGSKANVIQELAEEIGKKTAQAEALGEAGEVEESMKLMEDIEKLKNDKARAENEYRNSIPSSTYQQQKLRVCEVCSAYLGINDDDSRLADHFGGKLHLSFLMIREKLTELEKTAGPRKLELKRRGYRGRDDESQYFVGGRDLDRRSRQFSRSGRRSSRSRSGERDRGERGERNRDNRERDYYSHRRSDSRERSYGGSRRQRR